MIAQVVFLLERGQTDKQTDRFDWTPYQRPRLCSRRG